ncbi:hypothetical protein QAD02_006860 [Eretmocerus hayati]|uniref:Uncharacterized protein n=1 Tax=Eretmocerus hayati TaxID=131215 RepID=A0ACC2N242_9HYME|nr:hypothetical protein QAD02_006860 [Eretmocerus hayati]
MDRCDDVKSPNDWYWSACNYIYGSCTNNLSREKSIMPLINQQSTLEYHDDYQDYHAGNSLNPTNTETGSPYYSTGSYQENQFLEQPFSSHNASKKSVISWYDSHFVDDSNLTDYLNRENQQIQAFEDFIFYDGDSEEVQVDEDITHNGIDICRSSDQPNSLGREEIELNTSKSICIREGVQKLSKSSSDQIIKQPWVQWKEQNIQLKNVIRVDQKTGEKRGGNDTNNTLRSTLTQCGPYNMFDFSSSALPPTPQSKHESKDCNRSLDKEKFRSKSVSRTGSNHGKQVKKIWVPLSEQWEHTDNETNFGNPVQVSISQTRQNSRGNDSCNSKVSFKISRRGIDTKLLGRMPKSNTGSFASKINRDLKFPASDRIFQVHEKAEEKLLKEFRNEEARENKIKAATVQEGSTARREQGNMDEEFPTNVIHNRGIREESPVVTNEQNWHKDGQYDAEQGQKEERKTLQTIEVIELGVERLRDVVEIHLGTCIIPNVKLFILDIEEILPMIDAAEAELDRGGTLLLIESLAEVLEEILSRDPSPTHAILLLIESLAEVLEEILSRDLFPTHAILLLIESLAEVLEEILSRDLFPTHVTLLLIEPLAEVLEEILTRDLSPTHVILLLIESLAEVLEEILRRDLSPSHVTLLLIELLAEV